MTRKTKLYKASYIFDNKKNTVYFKTLTSSDIGFLSNIKNISEKYDQAAKRSIVDTNPELIPWTVRLKIGEDIFESSSRSINDQQLFEITVKNLRENVKNDPVLWCISKIRQVWPNQSLTELLNLTIDDLIEMVCFCEELTDQKLFNVDHIPRKSKKLVNPGDLPDGGKSFMDKIKNLSVPK
jgi:hypothetical protein